MRRRVVGREGKGGGEGEGLGGEGGSALCRLQNVKLMGGGGGGLRKEGVLVN